MLETKRYSLSEYLNHYKSNGTKGLYKRMLEDFFKIVYLKNDSTDLEELSLNYVDGMHDYKGDLIKLRDAHPKDSPMTSQVRFSAVNGFLAYNEILISPKFRKDLIGSPEPISEEHIPTREELRRICEHLPFNAKVLTIFLVASGCRIGEVLQLKISDLKLGESPPKVNLRFETTKTQRKRWTYLTSEAKSLLEEWIRFRGEYIRKSNEMVKGIVPPKVDDGRVFPFTDDLFYMQWKAAVRKAGLMEVDEKTGHMTIHVHCLRKYFRVRGGWVNPEFPEMLLGHIAGVRGVYARYDESQLAEAYLKAGSNLSVFEQSDHLIELKEQVRKQSDQTDMILKNIVVKNIELENKLKATQETFDNYHKLQMEDTAKQIGELQQQIRSLEYHLDRYEEELTHVSGR